MGDVEAARRQLDATLRRVKWTGWFTLLAGLVLGVVALPLGIAVAVVGLILSVGAGFARGYYLG